jgi:hypothetical protein
VNAVRSNLRKELGEIEVPRSGALHQRPWPIPTAGADEERPGIPKKVVRLQMPL